MAEPERMDELSLLLDAARKATPPALSPAHQQHMVNVALQSAALRPRGAQSLWYGAALAALVLLAVITQRLLQHGGPRPEVTLVEVAPDGLPLRLSLRTGDALVLAPSAKLEVLSESKPLRRLRLSRGAVLFDVTHLAPGQNFEVETEQARVQVRGTVFSVRVDGRRTSVHVHEGSVYVGSRVLRAGEHWASSGRASAEPPQFAADVRAALAARAGTQVRTEALPHATPITPPVSDPPDAALPRAPAPRAGSARDSAQRPLTLASEPVALDTAEALLRTGQADTLLLLLREHHDDPRYARLVAEALRMLGEFSQATDAFEAVAAKSQGSTRTQAGFAAAQLAFTALHDPERALALLQRFALDAHESALRERASALRIDALIALGRSDEARREVQRYLAREPETETSVRLRRLTNAAAE